MPAALQLCGWRNRILKTVDRCRLVACNSPTTHWSRTTDKMLWTVILTSLLHRANQRASVVPLTASALRSLSISSSSFRSSVTICPIYLNLCTIVQPLGLPIQNNRWNVVWNAFAYIKWKNFTPFRIVSQTINLHVWLTIGYQFTQSSYRGASSTMPSA